MPGTAPRPVPRRGIDDHTTLALMFEHLPDLVFHSQPNALQIRTHRLVEIRLTEIGHRSDSFVGCGPIVKSAIQPPTGFDRGGNKSLDIFGFWRHPFEQTLQLRRRSQFLLQHQAPAAVFEQQSRPWLLPGQTRARWLCRSRSFRRLRRRPCLRNASYDSRQLHYRPFSGADPGRFALIVETLRVV